MVAQAITGDKKILLFRLLRERPYAAAAKLALQVQHNVKEESKVESTQTKDGSVPSASQTETTIELEALASDDDVNKMLHYAATHQEKIEVWEVDISKPKSAGKYEAKYGVGLLNGWEADAETGKNASIKPQITIEGTLVNGDATLDAQQEEAVKLFFYDTVADAKGTEPVPEYVPKTSAALKTVPVK